MDDMSLRYNFKFVVRCLKSLLSSEGEGWNEVLFRNILRLFYIIRVIGEAEYRRREWRMHISLSILRQGNVRSRCPATSMYLTWRGHMIILRRWPVNIWLICSALIHQCTLEITQQASFVNAGKLASAPQIEDPLWTS